MGGLRGRGADPGYLWIPLNDHLVDKTTTLKIQLFCANFPPPPVPGQFEER